MHEFCGCRLSMHFTLQLCIAKSHRRNDEQRKMMISIERTRASRTEARTSRTCTRAYPGWSIGAQPARKETDPPRKCLGTVFRKPGHKSGGWGSTLVRFPKFLPVIRVITPVRNTLFSIYCCVFRWLLILQGLRAHPTSFYLVDSRVTKTAFPSPHFLLSLPREAQKRHL